MVGLSVRGLDGRDEGDEPGKRLLAYLPLHLPRDTRHLPRRTASIVPAVRLACLVVLVGSLDQLVGKEHTNGDTAEGADRTEVPDMRLEETDANQRENQHDDKTSHDENFPIC